MDFGFTEEQEEFKKEVHDFFINELPIDFDGSVTAKGEKLQSFYLELQKKVGKRGWLTASWPKEYGGLGLGDIERGIVDGEQGYWKFFWPSVLGIRQCGPAVLLFGTEEQKRKFLPSMASGEAIWFQAFTEPDAGSDEANVQLRAVADGDDFILNGQKTFITGAYKPDWLYVLARTSDTKPKHRGLTLFLVRADTPGVTYRILEYMDGVQGNEIFFDDVRVSKEYVVGEINRGFYNALATFEFERSNVGDAAWIKRELEEFVQFCKETKSNGRPLFDDPRVRDRLAQIAVESEVFRLACWRTVWAFSEREKLGPLDYDLAAFFWKIFLAPHCETMMNILGPYGQLQRGSKWAQLAGSIENRWQRTRSFHAGGTIEMIKRVLAERTLHLPRKL